MDGRGFARAYFEPPVVSIALTMWDLAKDANARMHVEAKDISETGFSIVFRTWRHQGCPCLRRMALDRDSARRRRLGRELSLMATATRGCFTTSASV